MFHLRFILMSFAAFLLLQNVSGSIIILDSLDATIQSNYKIGYITFSNWKENEDGTSYGGKDEVDYFCRYISRDYRTDFPFVEHSDMKYLYCFLKSEIKRENLYPYIDFEQSTDEFKYRIVLLGITLIKKSSNKPDPDSMIGFPIKLFLKGDQEEGTVTILKAPLLIGDAFSKLVSEKKILLPQSQQKAKKDSKMKKVGNFFKSFISSSQNSAEEGEEHPTASWWTDSVSKGVNYYPNDINRYIVTNERDLYRYKSGYLCFADRSPSEYGGLAINTVKVTLCQPNMRDAFSADLDTSSEDNSEDLCRYQVYCFFNNKYLLTVKIKTIAGENNLIDTVHIFPDTLTILHLRNSFKTQNIKSNKSATYLPIDIFANAFDSCKKADSINAEKTKNEEQVKEQVKTNAEYLEGIKGRICNRYYIITLSKSKLQKEQELMRRSGVVNQEKVYLLNKDIMDAEESIKDDVQEYFKLTGKKFTRNLCQQ